MKNVFIVSVLWFLSFALYGQTTSKLIPSDCGSDNVEFNRNLSAVQKAGASKYEFKVENVTLGISETIIKTSNTFRLEELSNAIPDHEAYNVQVRLEKNGVFGSFGDVCAIEVNDHPNTALKIADCNRINVQPGDQLEAQIVGGATKYEFRVKNDALGMEERITKVNNDFQLSELNASLKSNTQYQVEVRTKLNGKWGNWGDICPISTLNFGSSQLLPAYCNRADLEESDVLKFNFVPFATSYTVKVTLVAGSVTLNDEFTLLGNSFSLDDLPNIGYRPNSIYEISIVPNAGNIVATQGAVCTVSTKAIELSYCGAEDVSTFTGEKKEIFDEMNKAVAAYVEGNQNSNARSGVIDPSEPIKIPVVVHVIHSGEAYGQGANISYSQIQSQIDALNVGFNGQYSSYNQNKDGDVNTNIQFCLAYNTWDALGASPKDSVDWTIAGEPGVMRYNNPVITFNNISTGGANGQNAIAEFCNDYSANPPFGRYFPFDKYLNIYVVTDIANDVLGYAPTPIGPLFNGGNEILDGVVIRASVFGDVTNPAYNSSNWTLYSPINGQFMSKDQGKTLVHEVGHYLFLLHTFQGGCSGSTSGTCSTDGDLLCDTDPCQLDNPVFWFCPGTTSNNCNSTPFIQWDNFMYYLEDPCQRTFTSDQNLRMRGFIQSNASRRNLVSPPNHVDVGLVASGCVSPVLTADFNINNSISCVNDSVEFDVLNGSGYAATQWEWDFGDGTLIGAGSGTISHINTFGTYTNPIHIYSSPGTYIVKLIAYDGTDTISQSEDVRISSCSPIQAENGNWFFGKYAGISFSSGIGQVNHSAYNAVPKSINTIESSVSLSDSLGSLLFYTDGSQIFNSNHQEITTISPLTLLRGNISSSQILSFPVPGEPNKYYVFYHGGELGDPVPPTTFSTSRLYYSIIEINGSNVSITGTKDIPVTCPSCTFPTMGEAIKGTPHCNGYDYWVIGDARTDKKLVSYLVTNGGVEEKQVTSSGFSQSYLAGNLKFSHDGKKLAFAKDGEGIMLYDFNNHTGEISNPVILNDSNGGYGIEFSPSDDYLYASIWSSSFTQKDIVRYDLTSANPGATETLISNTPSQIIRTNPDYIWYGDLQLGPDSIIYIAKKDDYPFQRHQDLAMITDPDNFSSPGFIRDGLDLAPGGELIYTQLDLPEFVDSKDAIEFKPPYFSDSLLNCSTAVYVIPPCWRHWYKTWDLGDGTVITSDDPISGSNISGTHDSLTYTYSQIGANVTLILSNGNVSFTMNKQMSVIAGSINITGATVICDTTQSYFYSIPLFDDISYQWIVTGGVFTDSATTFNGTSTSVKWGGSGGSIQIISTNGDSICDIVSTINVTVSPQPVLQLDTNFQCQEDSLQLLDASIPGGVWSGVGVTDSSAGFGVFDPSDPQLQMGGLGNLVVYDLNGCKVASRIVVGYTTSITSPLEYCQKSDSIITLTGFPTGGVWDDFNSGAFINSIGELDLRTIPPGDYPLVYGIPMDSTVCVDSVLDTLHILAAPILNAIDDTICFTNNDQTVWATPTNGIWSGVNITDNGDGTGTFNPSNFSVGDSLVAHYQIFGGCADSIVITLIPNYANTQIIPTNPIFGLSNQLCFPNSGNTITIMATATETGGSQLPISWYDPNGSFVGNGNLIDANQIGFYTAVAESSLGCKVSVKEQVSPCCIQDTFEVYIVEPGAYNPVTKDLVSKLSSVSTKNLFIKGDITLRNYNGATPFILDGYNIYVNEASHYLGTTSYHGITIENSDFTLTNSSIQSICDDMWEGFTLRSGGSLSRSANFNNSTIEDALVGISKTNEDTINTYYSFNVDSCVFNDNFVGIQASYLVKVDYQFTNNTFNSSPSSFKIPHQNKISDKHLDLHLVRETSNDVLIQNNTFNHSIFGIYLGQSVILSIEPDNVFNNNYYAGIYSERNTRTLSVDGCTFNVTGSLINPPQAPLINIRYGIWADHRNLTVLNSVFNGGYPGFTTQVGLYQDEPKASINSSLILENCVFQNLQTGVSLMSYGFVQQGSLTPKNCRSNFTIEDNEFDANGIGIDFRPNYNWTYSQLAPDYHDPNLMILNIHCNLFNEVSPNPPTYPDAVGIKVQPGTYTKDIGDCDVSTFNTSPGGNGWPTATTNGQIGNWTSPADWISINNLGDNFVYYPYGNEFVADANAYFGIANPYPISQSLSCQQSQNTGSTGITCSNPNIIFAIPAENYEPDVITETYPNPAHDHVFINYNFQDDQILNTNLKLVNSLGAVVYEVDSVVDSNGNMQIPLSNLPSGAYVVVLTRNGKSSRKTIGIVK